MTHQEAERAAAVARYLLGEMSEEEREAFEEHLFDCPQCARIVHAELILKTCPRAAGRQEIRQEEGEQEGIGSALTSLLRWVSLRPRISALSMLAAALALPWLTYREFVALPRLQREIAELTAPQPLAYHHLESFTRGSRIVKIQEGCRKVALWFELGDNYGYEAYRCDVESRTGKRFSVPGMAADGLTMRMLVSCSDLPEGSYTLALHGVREGGEDLLETFGFEVQLE